MNIYNEVFNIEYQFKKYLILSKQTGIKGQQLIETRRAFMAGMSSFMVVQVDHMAELDEDDAVQVLERFKTQLQRFWEQEAKAGG